jgi:beta-glucosidase
MITEVLRDTLHFDGFVVSDYDAWSEVVDTHHYVATYEEAAVVGLSAGMDQEGGGGPVYPPVQQGIPAAVQDGLIQEAQLQQAVRRLFRARLRLGMFDPPASLSYNSITHAEVASAEHLALAELAAREGMTLLKNAEPSGSSSAALPLSLSALSGKKLAVLGPNGNSSYILLGSYSDPGCCSAGIPTLLQELSSRAGSAGVAISYEQGCDANCAGSSGFAAAAAAAAAADGAVVLALGMGDTQFACGGNKVDKSACEAEAYDRTTCALPGLQPALVAAVRAAMRPGVPLIGVLVHGGALCLDPATLGALDALLDAWYPGMRGAAAMADAIIGAFSPAGRSPVTWYASDAALPADRGQMSPYPNASSNSPGITYRFYEPESAGVAPAVFTFGEGLSYTTFSASAPSAPASVRACDSLLLSVLVSNTGAMDSDVVVQVFLAQAGLSVPAPATRLAAFSRVFIAKGQQLRVTLPPIEPTGRSVIHADGGNATNVYSLAGKRWNEAGVLQLRVVLGEHGGDRAGGLAFNVTQVGSQDLLTC